MDFQLGPDHELIRRTVREFADREVRPHAAAWDEAGRLPESVLAAMAELDLFGLPFPEQYGGVGFDYLAYVLAVKEIGRASGSLALDLCRPRFPGDISSLPVRHRGAKATLAGALCPRADIGRVCPHRTQRRVRCGCH